MSDAASRHRDNAVEARVTIERPVADVFSFYRDLENLPRFLGDVLGVERTGPATYRWTIEGPLGVRLRSTVRLTEERTNELIRYETRTAPGMRTEWAVHFAPGSGPTRTEVHEVLTTPLGRLGHAALILIGKPPATEVAANLRRLKQLLETGEVTDTDHAVAGKFGRLS
ncbi:SRPBCC family protein [Micromonospora sp. WMMD812]|uniref:SRPBCC family protein n=1 Tax=Micromonospora sp. WMMD812 TaxID=3015152 RepID=UPI00248C2743|nr:SRPBCC family protein [Micromonospora sp. WMMD812]WBB65366.1 SRPBCC family protein [Micromonospora sp. WMMD812]